MSISLSFPAWYGIVCVVIGLAYAIFLYRNDKLLKELSRSWKILLSSFRFIIVTILALLLLEPLLESVTSKVEKPVIVLLQDNSESLLLSRDSAVIQSEFIEQLAALKTDLGEKYEIQSYTFGNEIRQGLKVDFTDKTTNISNVFDEVYTRYYNRNVGAIILATDGIYNSGTDPTYSAQKIKNTSIFTIALGDTNSRKDIIITEIAYNRLAYLGNIFPIEIAIAGKQCEGAKTSVDIIHDGKTISSQIISIDKNEYFTIVPFQIEANKSGLQKYSVVVSSIEGELTVENNSKEIYIEVLNSKQKVLLLAGAANPDIYALKVAVEKNKNYEVDVQLLSEFKGEVNDYSLVIAHQIPFKSTSLPEVLNFSSSRIPIFYVLGSQTNFNKFNSLNAGLNLLAPKG
ncbi:MAG: VWA domain-containing protein, partial [Crocinitomicaceae bacterium]|nr:VWA domain-containing protein [Crocinitomicaceae bacterium]